MKFTLITAITAGAVLLQVGASPLRVAVVEGRPTNLRFGHPVSNSNANFNPNLAMVVRPGHGTTTRRGPCLGALLRNKAKQISNAFRKTFGRPIPPPKGSYAIQILPFDGKPNKVIEYAQFFGPDTAVSPDAPSVPSPTHIGHFSPSSIPPSLRGPYLAHPRPHYEHSPHAGHARFMHRIQNAPFTTRLHVALMALGPWEGRAVAFVLGCGLGVLLRMIFVLTLVSYRFIRGSRKDKEYTEVIFVEEYEEPQQIAIAPPTYTDEKVDKDNATV